MVKLDSIKFAVPFDAFKDIELSYRGMTESKKFQDNKEVEHSYTWSAIDHGFNSFHINNLKNEVVFSTSAKILKENYYDGISLNTIEQFHHNIEKSGLCKIHVCDLLEHGKVLTVDNTTNIELDSLRKSVDAVVRHGSINGSYEIDHYRETNGYVARRKVKSYKERQIGYCKIADFNKADSKAFNLDHPQAIRRFTKNTLRVESNCTSFKRIRDTYNILDTRLGTVLNSTENVNLKLFQKIISKGKQLDIFGDYFDGMSLPEIAKEIGYKGILARFENDLISAKLWIRTTYTKGKHYYYYRLLDDAYTRLNAPEIELTNKHIERIEELLKVS